MRVSINIFNECLRDMQAHFKTLNAAEVIYDKQGIAPAISRTKNFAEAQIILNEKQYIVCMPLTQEALIEARNTAKLIAELSSSIFGEYKILDQEMIVTNHKGQIQRVDILLHEVAQGETLHSFVDYADTQRLLAAVEALECEMRRIGVAHNNLSPHNIIVSKDYSLTPFRYHYVSCDDCSAEFIELKEWIMTVANIGNHELGVKPISQSIFDKYEYVSSPFEGLILVRDNEGYLYINDNDEVKIKGRFEWAGDFKEGRAEVETESGMGLINNMGEYVIPAIYEIVEFDPKSGLSRVRQEDKWGLFSYDGKQILPFEQRLIDDVDIEIMSI